MSWIRCVKSETYKVCRARGPPGQLHYDVETFSFDHRYTARVAGWVACHCLKYIVQIGELRDYSKQCNQICFSKYVSFHLYSISPFTKLQRTDTMSKCMKTKKIKAHHKLHNQEIKGIAKICHRLLVMCSFIILEVMTSKVLHLFLLLFFLYYDAINFCLVFSVLTESN